MYELGENIQDKVADVVKQTMKEADLLILEYMQKRNLTIEDLQGNVAVQQEQQDSWEVGVSLTRTYWYKGELILSVKQKFDVRQPLCARGEMVIKKGDW